VLHVSNFQFKKTNFVNLNSIKSRVEIYRKFKDVKKLVCYITERRLGTVDLLAKIAYFVKKKHLFSVLKAANLNCLAQGG